MKCFDQTAHLECFGNQETNATDNDKRNAVHNQLQNIHLFQKVCKKSGLTKNNECPN